MSNAPLEIVIVGHVDHGKSTLIGRLLHETGSLPEGKVEELTAVSERRGVPIEWSFVLDSLQAERDQAITIDTTRIWFTYDDHRYAIIDAPGHRQFISNMLSGAADAEAAILIVDVEEGISEQTRRHAYLLAMLGIEQIVVGVNKMDLVGYDEARFRSIATDVAALLKSNQLTPAATIPISAREGANLVQAAATMPWYDGPTIMQALGALASAPRVSDGPLRIRVQDIYRYGTERVIVGRIESGTLSTGDPVLIAPSRARANIESLRRWPNPGPPTAKTGESIGFVLDQPIFAERGDIVCDPDAPPALTRHFRAAFFWLDETPPKTGEAFKVRFGPSECRVTVEKIEAVYDTTTLEPAANEEAAQYSLIELALRSDALLPLDTRASLAVTSRCVLLRGIDPVAGGVVREAMVPATNLRREEHLVTEEERSERLGHSGAVVWLTGLSGAGKSTLAMALERRLFSRGMFVFVLDGDNVRHGLNSDLGFSDRDRAENIRRVGEVAALFAQAGAIVITAFISPFTADRRGARAAAGKRFHEIYVKASLETCERRDAKGLYKRARAGEIAEFTGITSPYEPPEKPELVIDTDTLDPEVCVEMLAEYITEGTTQPVPVS